MNEPKLLTVGAIATRLRVPVHRVQHLIKSRGIKPSSRAGIFRVFDEAACERIAAELKKPK